MIQRLWIVWGLVTAVSCFAGGYWLADRKAPLERTVFKDRVVVQHSEKHDDISTVTERKVTKPSGEVIETKTTQIDKSVQKQSQTEREKTQETTRVAQALPQYGVGFSYRPQDRVWGVEVSRRLLGPVWLGGAVNQRLELSLGLRLEF